MNDVGNTQYRYEFAYNVEICNIIHKYDAK